MTAPDESAARFTEVVRGLLQRWPESRLQPDLDRIARLCDLLGNPQRAYPVIHVTGTNGKTSTARMIDSLLRPFGLVTGLYTSPHLTSVTERIEMAGEPIDTGRFLAAWDDISAFVDLVDQSSGSGDDAVPLSFFEVLTGLAYAAFADAPVSVAVVEVGMGGAWDATNVADGVVAVVTPISIDHVDYLGGTVPEIAAEKAGIIKPGAIAVLADQPAQALPPLLARVRDRDARLVRAGADFGVIGRSLAVGGQVLTIQGLGGTYDEIFLPLHGRHQAANAAVALAAVEAFLGGGRAPLDGAAVREGFAAVTSPARLEVVRRGPTVLVDAAHNPAGAQALAAAVTDSFDFRHLVGVVGVLADKDAFAILQALEPVLASVIITAPASPRALPADDLAAIAVDVFGSDRVGVELRLDDAIEAAVREAEDVGEYAGAGVLVTGSVVTAGQARLLLRGSH